MHAGALLVLPARQRALVGGAASWFVKPDVPEEERRKVRDSREMPVLGQSASVRRAERKAATAAAAAADEKRNSDMWASVRKLVRSPSFQVRMCVLVRHRHSHPLRFSIYRGADWSGEHAHGFAIPHQIAGHARCCGPLCNAACDNSRHTGFWLHTARSLHALSGCRR